MSDHFDPVWDCTSHYSIRPKIHTRDVIDVSSIKLRRNTDEYLEGFDTAKNDTDIDSAEKESESRRIFLRKY
jgi:hypothetical protein